MIPVCDPKSGNLVHSNEISEALQRVVESGWYILGEEGLLFEEEFAAYCNIPYCAGCGNGTDAIELTLRGLNIGSGDVVLTVANTAVATAAAIERTGAKVDFVDIDPITYTMSPKSLQKILSKNNKTIKAIIVVHLFGLPADMEQLLEITDSHNLPLIEDCAQAHGAAIGDTKVGSFGIAGTFSFYPTKNLGALGDGGAIVSRNQELVQSFKYIRQYGWRKHYISSRKGINSRLDEMQAAILRVKLKYLQNNNNKRRDIARIYDKELKSIPEIITPVEVKNYRHVYHQYVIQAKNRDNLKKYLKENGISSAIHYPVPIHHQPAYIDCSSNDLKVTEKVNKQILSLPIFPELNIDDIWKIIHCINKFYK